METSPTLTATPSSLRSRRSRSGSLISEHLSLDLSNVPSLGPKPSDPSNTLLLTNLTNDTIFAPESADTDELRKLRERIEEHVPIFSWSPLRSLRRVVVTFYDVASAVAIRDIFDRQILLDCTVRIYFAPNNIDISSVMARYLAAPRLTKQFLISPPPSPPHDWTIREEEPPNTEVHAEDLAKALAQLRARDQDPAPEMIMHDPEDPAAHQKFDNTRVRSRSTTLVYEPTAHGSNAELPMISVEDCEFVDAPEEQARQAMDDDAVFAAAPPPPPPGPMLHTARPPIELMQS